jgi:hypothetical protein
MRSSWSASFRLDDLAGVDGEAGVDPAQKRIAEVLRETPGTMQAAEYQPSERLRHDIGVEEGQGEECAAAYEGAVGDQGVQMGVEVGERPEGLDRDDHPGQRVVASEHRLEALFQRLERTPGEESQEPALTFEQASDRLGDGEDEMSVGNGREDLLPELLGEQGRALGLAGRTEVPGLARERQQVLPLARRAAYSGEAVVKTAAVEERLDAAAHDRAQRSARGLEPLLVDACVVLEMRVDNPVEVRALGVARAVDSRGFADEQAVCCWSGQRGAAAAATRAGRGRGRNHGPPSSAVRGRGMRAGRGTATSTRR